MRQAVRRSHEERVTQEAGTLCKLSFSSVVKARGYGR